jgi:hypothetical protein
MRALTMLMCLLAQLAGPAMAAAQQQPDSTAASGNASSLMSKVKVDRGGGFHLTPHWAVVFGGIKQGSGAAAGPALSQEWANGAYAQVKAVYSIRSFKLLQARFDSQPLFGRGVTLSTRVRWQDAPELSLYHLGTDSPNLRAEYAERKTEWSGVAKLPLARTSVLLGGVGVERYATSGGWVDEGEDDAPDAVPQTPGLGTRPWFVHSFVEIVQDSRLSPDFSRTGRLLDAAFHVYHDAHDGTQSFRRLELAAYQLVPDWAHKGAVGVGARTWLSDTGDAQQVPFFLMPALGGGNYLRGYSTYRFRDRNALVIQAEYSYPVHPMIDVAGLYEAGSVSATAGGLSLTNMAQSAGVGVRVHTKMSGLFRADLARGRDGFKVAFGFGLGGS